VHREVSANPAASRPPFACTVAIDFARRPGDPSGASCCAGGGRVHTEGSWPSDTLYLMVVCAAARPAHYAAGTATPRGATMPER
jgi:hypothetical protein